jgi:hypothetical protein
LLPLANPPAPGTAGTVGNSRCSIDSAGSAVTTIGADAFSSNVRIALQPGAFGGAKKIFGLVAGKDGLVTHWVRGGSFTVLP